MAIRAYNDIYLNNAQNILGHASDFAIITLGLDPDLFANAFAVSDISRQFAIGNPQYVAGINGCELTRLVLAEAHIRFTDTEDIMYLDKSPEYWAGWALAFYQWYSSRSFIHILTAVSFSQIIQMYPVCHEMDISQFTERMDSLLTAFYPHTQLKTMRINCGLSQSELADASGVALRQIQLFEQRQRDISKASAITLLRLSRSLHCRMEDLMEY